MTSSQAGCGRGDADIERDDLDRQALQEIVDQANSLITASGRRDEGFGEGGGRHGEPISAVDCVGDGLAGSWVMDVVVVEESDEDASVEVDQCHSSRSSSSS